MRGRFHILLCATAAVAIWCGCTPAGAEEISLLEGRCTIAVPEGWRADNSYGDAGLVLYPPDARAWPLELVIWAMPEGAAETAEAAALAHEAAIRRDYPYTRREQAEFSTADGLAGLQIIGEVQTAGNHKVACVFAAFACKGRYYVLGTFAVPQQLDITISRYLAPVARNLRITARPGQVDSGWKPEPRDDNRGRPEPRDNNISQPDEPTLGPALPVVGPRYDADVTPPAPAAGAEELYLLSDQYLQLKAPRDYEIELVEGKWLIHPRGVASRAIGLVVWPLVCPRGTMTAAEVARTALQQWELSAGQDFDFRPCSTPAAGSGSAVVFSGTGRTASGQVQVLGSCSMAGEAALLAGFYVVPDRAARDWPLLLRMLASVRAEEVPVGDWLQAPPCYRWQVPDYPALSVAVPEGWLARGRVEPNHGLWTISIEAADPGPRRLYISWQQPLVPLFRQLTTLLQAVGWKRLDRYSPDLSSQPYLLLSRLAPAQFIAEYWNRQTRVSLQEAQVIEQSQPEALKGLITAGDAETLQTVVAGEATLGPRRNHYLVAVGSTGDHDGHTWQAAVLEASGPAHESEQAVAALRAMIEGAALTEAEEPEADIPPELDDMLEQARQAVSLLPPIAAGTMGNIASALELSTQEGARVWQTPTGALEVWKRALNAARYGQQPEDLLPELHALQKQPRNW